VRLIFINAEGVAVAETLRVYKRIIGLPDGDHLVPPSAIFRDRARKLPALCIIWQGVPVAEGAPDDHALLDMTFREVEAHRKHLRPLKASRYFWRRTLFWCVVISKAAVLVVFSALALLLSWVFLL